MLYPSCNSHYENDDSYEHLLIFFQLLKQVYILWSDAPNESTHTTSDKLDDNITIRGNLTVSGATTTINSTTLTVDDKNIEIASVDSPTDVTAADAGITINGTTDKTLQWKSATNSLSSNVKLAENAGSSAFHRPLTTMLGLG